MKETMWERVKAVFDEASALPADERGSFLDRQCAGDADLRSEVDALLKSHEDLPTDDSAMITVDGPPVEGVGEQIGRYKLLQAIGEGGFGTVYMAEQEEPVRRRVALKIIKLGMDTREVIARFEAERQALALMDHPNIAKVLDAGATESGRPFFVMELVRGIPITEYCDQNKLGTTERLELFMAVCGAVQHAHQKGIIHRDIKPSNVMVTLHDGTPVPKIIDFGIAKATNQRLTEKTLFTQFNQFIGTPAYMSPEQAEMSGLDVDTRSDIYSLGVLLYELLTGTTPLDAQEFRRAGFGEIQRLIREAEPHRPSVRISTLGRAATTAAEQRQTDLPGLAKALKGDLDWVVMKALEKDRTRRYETANAMRMDLQRFLADEPVLASPPGAVYRLRKFVRRNRTGVVVGSIVTAALIIGLLTAAGGLIRAQREAEASKAINEFFNGMLASVDPRQLHQHSGFAPEGKRTTIESTGVLARDISVAEMMMRARSEISTSFLGKPDLEATARETIGLALLGLGRPRESAAELEEATEIRRSVFGRNHPDTLRSELQFSLSLVESGRAPDALPLLGNLRGKMADLYGVDDPRTLRASSLYANALAQDRRHTEADPIFVETLERQRAVLGEANRDTLDTMLWRAESLQWRNRGAEAEKFTRPAYETALRTFGPDDVITLYARTNLGWSCNFQGARGEGEALLRPAVEGLERALGNDHPYTAVAKIGLGRSIRDRDGGVERERLWTEALEGLRATEGSASPVIYVISRDLAEVLLKRGKHEEALRLYRRAVDDFRIKYGEDHRWTIDNKRYLVAGLWWIGETAEAEAVSRELLDRQRQVAESPDANAGTLNSLAWDLLTWDPPEVRDPKAALPLAERALEIAPEEDRALILDTVALAMHLTGRNSEAIVSQREALALIPQSEAVEWSTYASPLVRFLSAEEMEDEARELVIESVGVLESAAESADDFVINIGRFSNDLENERLFEEAETARREALDVVRARWGSDSSAVAGLDYRLGRVLLHQGRAREAEDVLREGVSLARQSDDDEVLNLNQINLAEVLAHRRRYSDVRAIATEILGRYGEDQNRIESLNSINSSLRMDAMRLLGTADLTTGDVDSAESLLHEAARWYERMEPPDSWRRARARSAWGAFLVRKGRFDEAEPILLETRATLVDLVGAQSTATSDATRRLKHLYRAWGKPSESARWAELDQGR